LLLIARRRYRRPPTPIASDGGDSFQGEHDFKVPVRDECRSAMVAR